MNDDSLPSRLLRAARLARAVPIAGLPGKQRIAMPDLSRLGALPRMPALPGLSSLPGLDLLQGLKGRKATARPGGQADPEAPGSFLAGSYSDAAGSRPYRLYVPARKVANPPLIVMLHGCTQTAEDFAAGTRMNALAEAAGALVLYPVQTSGANAQRCWNWFSPADQGAGRGEPAIVAGMTRWVIAEYHADPARVFVAGLSAGGAAAAVLGAAYPKLYAGIGVHSGLACGAASDVVGALSAMRTGHAGRGRIDVPAIIFHGDRDGTVSARNAAELAAQVAAENPSSIERGGDVGNLAWTRVTQAAAHGRPRLEQWTVHGAGHAWSGGSASGSYTEPRGPDASREMLRFFLDG